MKSVKCLKAGRWADSNNPADPIIEFKEGDVLELNDDFANRLIECEVAEAILAQEPVEEKPKRTFKKSASKKTASKKSR